MDNMQKEREKWNKQKAMGKKKFILVYGVLINMSLSIFFASFHIFVFNRTLLSNIQSIVLTYLIYILGWGLLGLATGNLLWKGNIKVFEK